MLYRPPTRLGDLALQHIGFTCMHHREGVWPGKPGYTFRFPRHWLRSETIHFGWKWTYFTGEELKLHHGQSSDYWCIHSELCSTWWVNISLTVVSTKKLFFSFFLLFLSFFLSFFAELFLAVRRIANRPYLITLYLTCSQPQGPFQCETGFNKSRVRVGVFVHDTRHLMYWRGLGNNEVEQTRWKNSRQQAKHAKLFILTFSRL